MTNPVYQWNAADGQTIGCGTASEFAYWQSQGIVETDAVMGDVLCHEPASEDAERAARWAA